MSEAARLLHLLASAQRLLLFLPERARAHPEIKTIPLDDLLQGFAMLVKGEIEAVIADRRVGTYVLARSGFRTVRMA